VEIATSVFGECEIDIAVRKWVNVGMSEKPSASPFASCRHKNLPSRLTVYSGVSQWMFTVVRGEAATLRERSKWITPRMVKQG